MQAYKRNGSIGGKGVVWQMDGHREYNSSESKIHVYAFLRFKPVRDPIRISIMDTQIQFEYVLRVLSPYIRLSHNEFDHTQVSPAK